MQAGLLSSLALKKLSPAKERKDDDLLWKVLRVEGGYRRGSRKENNILTNCFKMFSGFICRADLAPET